jgi:hypothetical protein
MEEKETFRFQKTIKITFSGDGSEEVISKLLELGETKEKPSRDEFDDGLRFFGARFRSAPGVLVCVWHVPRHPRFQTLRAAYMRPAVCDVAVISYRHGVEESLANARANVPPPSSERKTILLEICDGEIQESIEGSEDGVLRCAIGLNNVEPFLRTILSGLDFSYQRPLTRGEHDFSETSDFVEISLDDEPQENEEAAKLNFFDVMQHCQACLFL